MSEFAHDDVNRLRVALGRISRQLDRRISTNFATPTQMRVLATVSRRGPISATELADIEGLNPTMLSRILNKLEESEMVTRAPAPTDRRVVQIAVTAAGSRHHERWRTERAELLADHIAQIPDGDVRRLLAALPALEHLGEAMNADVARV